MRADWIQDLCCVNNTQVSCAEALGFFTFDIRFICGQDLPFVFRVDGFAVAMTHDDGIEAIATYDFGHRFVWGGFSNVRVGTTAVTDYDYRSGTGHDWRLSSIDNGPSNVPEPATASLMVVALGGAWWARRRRGA